MTEKQRQENLLVAKKKSRVFKDYLDFSKGGIVLENRLYTCNARTYRRNNIILLESYNTVVACIDLDTQTCYDFLRLVYGYTATSAQHIRKFMNKYGIVRKKTWHD